MTQVKELEQQLAQIETLQDVLAAKVSFTEILQQRYQEIAHSLNGKKILHDIINQVASEVTDRFAQNFQVREFDGDVNLDELKRNSPECFDKYIDYRQSEYKKTIRNHLIMDLGTHPAVAMLASKLASVYSLFGNPKAIYSQLKKAQEAQFEKLCEEKMDLTMQLQMLAPDKVSDAAECMSKETTPTLAISSYAGS